MNYELDINFISEVKFIVCPFIGYNIIVNLCFLFIKAFVSPIQLEWTKYRINIVASTSSGELSCVGFRSYLVLKHLAANADSFAAKRMRKIGQRRAVDYTSTVVRYMQVRPVTNVNYMFLSHNNWM